MNCKLFSIFDNKIIYHDIIESIVNALDAKDNYTAEHSRRVGDMADVLCKILNIKNSKAELIHLAGHVHDIGKIGVPDNVLNKNGRLNDDEWDIMKQHPVIGANILGKSRKLENISEIILYHHERYDGKGYPYGISGEKIPLGARIIAVCDSIDAMMSKRAYRNSLPESVCRTEIEKNVGLMYDPYIAKCVLDNWNHIVYK